MKYSTLPVVLILTLVLFIPLVKGDGGIIPPTPSTPSISEPGQNAIIGWNGEKERLILGNHFRVHGDQEVTAIRIVPFPVSPTVKKADSRVFDRVDNEVKRIKRRHIPEWMDDRIRWEISQKQRLWKPGVEKYGDISVKWRSNIGSHNLTVYYVNDVNEFTSFVYEKFRAEGIQLEIDLKTYQKTQRVIESYLDRNINYFVMDVVQIDGETKVEPLMYEFETERIYYPLVISKLASSVNKLKLAVFTKGKPTYNGLCKSPNLRMWAEGWMDKRGVDKISGKIASLFDEGPIYFGFYSNIDNLDLSNDIYTQQLKVKPTKSYPYFSILSLSLAIIVSLLFIYPDYRREDGENTG